MTVAFPEVPAYPLRGGPDGGDDAAGSHLYHGDAPVGVSGKEIIKTMLLNYGLRSGNQDPVAEHEDVGAG